MIIEYTAISVYVIILAFITWISAYKKNPKDFLFAARNITWAPLSVSIFSSVISSYNFVVILTFSFLYGPYVLLIFLGVLAAFVGIYLLAKRYSNIIRADNFNNIIDFFVQRFDRRVATTLNIAFVGALLLFITLQFFVNTSIFSAFLGWGKYVSALFVGVIVYVYTTLGGLKTEIFTDVFQGVLMLAVGALVFTVDTSVITNETIKTVLTDKAAVTAAVSLGLAQFLTLLVQPEIWQRVTAAKSLAHLKKAFIAAWSYLLVIVIPLIIIGLAAHAGGGVENPGNILLEMLKDAAPAWYLPILIASLFAALMSTIDSSLFAISSQIGKHGLFVNKKRSYAEKNRRPDQQTVFTTRVAIGFVVVITLGGSLFFGGFLSGVFKLASLLTVISTAVVLAILFDVSSTEMFMMLLVGIALFIGAFTAGVITEKAITTLYPSFVLTAYGIIQTLIIRAGNNLAVFTD